MRLFLGLLLCRAAFAASSFNCPADENTGYFADPDECDKYWNCDRGLATAEYCPDGLAFSARARRSSNPCVYFWRADCAGKTLGEPLGTAPCTRENGFFPHEDPNNCVMYYQCTDNVPTVAKCAPGLTYNIDTHGCDWPESSKRGACQTKESIRDFVCPEGEYFNANGLREQHPRFNDRQDCRAFFVCLNGVTPQSVNCPLGEVFSEDTLSCTLAEFVPGCEDYYKDHPLRSKFKDLNGDGRVDVNLESFVQ